MPAAEGVRMERQVGVALALVEGAPSVLVESALFEEMLVGWRRQQLSRRLGGSLIEGREHQPVAVPRTPTRTSHHTRPSR
jgi:hypothetical protein